MKAADVWNWDSPKKTVECNYPGKLMSSGGGAVVLDALNSAAL